MTPAGQRSYRSARLPIITRVRGQGTGQRTSHSKREYESSTVIRPTVCRRTNIESLPAWEASCLAELFMTSYIGKFYARSVPHRQRFNICCRRLSV